MNIFINLECWSCPCGIVTNMLYCSTTWSSRDNVDSVMAKMLDCGLKVSKFKLQLCNYVHFLTNIPLSPSYGLNRTTTVLLRKLWNEITYEGWYAIKQRTQTKPK